MLIEVNTGVFKIPAIVRLYQIQTHLRKLHYVFDTDCSGIMTRARFSGKKGSFEPSCEVGYFPGCFFVC